LKNSETRIEKDSMGELKVPKDALYGAQTQRAIDNFPISGITIPRSFIRTLGLIKSAAAKVNADLTLLKPDIAKAIIDAADSVADGQYDTEFPLDIFQTGSGTSSNMNANEVIARLASLRSNLSIHPNDHVNMSQSSNDVIPTAIHASCSLDIKNSLLPALEHLHKIILERAKNLESTVKTGRTHLMDAMPLTFGQELSGWATQIQQNIARILDTLPRLNALAIGGTAVGTGINAHPEFGKRIATELHNKTQISFTPHTNYFAALSSQDTIVEFSGHLRVLAISLSKIANDLRLMNSGPLAGFNEIVLPSLQPGSSIMPGKINPVIPEAVLMAAAQVIGNDTTISIGGLSGHFQLNTMLPVIAYNILLSIKLMTNSAIALADKAIAGFVINQEHIEKQLSLNPILVTALNPIIGYEKGAEIAKRAYREKRSVKDVSAEMTNLSSTELDKLLDPKILTQCGIEKS
jgi:fumarate hydratase class II